MTTHDPRGALPDGHAAQHAASGRRYVYAWLALLMFTALSFGADHLRLGSAATIVALCIALIKASIVLVVFMHLGREPFPIRFVAVLNVAWVALLCLGIAADAGLLTWVDPTVP
jgi:caa(3)-type oxidase subunit IV